MMNTLKESEQELVTTYTLVYNHGPYLRQCLDGLVMQKTNFRFKCFVHDDASTDDSAAIIKEYVEKYPDMFDAVLETENQYSKHDGSLARIVAQHLKGKYVAMCEGDDYWTDPLKLQKQVSFLESHPDYSAACSRTKQYSQSKGTFLQQDVFCAEHDEDVPTEDIIRKGGLYLASCSLVYKREVRSNNYPEYCKKCHVGDYPLQIMCAMKGKVRYFNDAMGVYRVDNSHSWVGQTRYMGMTDRKINGILSELTMLKGFMVDYPVYKKAFLDRIGEYLFVMIRNTEKADKQKFYQAVQPFVTLLDWRWKLLINAFLSDHRIFQSATYRLNSKRINY